MKILMIGGTGNISFPITSQLAENSEKLKAQGIILETLNIIRII